GYLEKAEKLEDIEIEKQKKVILEAYLPATMNKEQTTELIQKLITEHNIADLKTQRGLLMKELMANYKSEIDAGLVNEIINEMVA
ncbi:MAG: GatB/YqeY domain-containing protein, partial [candidate division SR1 bacterium]|nr:GatB/YqeY domain-containing protein [candidate division SR1 bacterium]